jgi:hypothetical protein
MITYRYSSVPFPPTITYHHSSFNFHPMITYPNSAMSFPSYANLSTSRHSIVLLPWHVGTLPFHFAPSKQVSDFRPWRVYPELHWKFTVLPTLKSKLNNLPSSGAPGFRHGEAINQIHNRHYCKLLYSDFYNNCVPFSGAQGIWQWKCIKCILQTAVFWCFCTNSKFNKLPFSGEPECLQKLVII